MVITVVVAAVAVMVVVVVAFPMAWMMVVGVGTVLRITADASSIRLIQTAKQVT